MMSTAQAPRLFPRATPKTLHGSVTVWGGMLSVLREHETGSGVVPCSRGIASVAPGPSDGGASSVGRLRNSEKITGPILMIWPGRALAIAALIPASLTLGLFVNEL